MVGQFVLSTAGRDKGRIHVICGEADGEYFLIADGKTRKIDKPKRKKKKHCKLIGYKDQGLEEDMIRNQATDGQIEKAIRRYSLGLNATDLYDNR